MVVFDKLAPFLYRRLGRWITCELQLGDGDRIRLRTKYDVASFGDVFCHPFYWQAFQLLSAPPKLIVDCGANCGHFAVLAHRCVQARFPDARPSYLLIEPNPALLPIIRRNLHDAGLRENVRVEQVLLGNSPDGQAAGDGTLWVSKTNYLLSSIDPFPGAQPHRVRYAQLAALVGAEAVDLMKIDIEGAEFGLVESEAAVFARVNAILMEAHGTPQRRQDLVRRLEQAGLSGVGGAAHSASHGNDLLQFRRATPSGAHAISDPAAAAP